MTQHTPSRYQAAIYKWVLDGSGDGIVDAVPGSGKTTVLVEVANLLPAGTQALFCAFNKHIAVELEKRLPKNVKAQTINSLGAQTLRQNRLYATLDTFKYRGHEGIVSELAARFFPRLEDEEREELLDNARDLVDMARLTLAGPTTVEELTLTAQAFNSYRRSVEESARVASYTTALCDVAVEYDLSLPTEQVARVVVNSIVEGITRARGTRDRAASIDFTDQVYLPVVLRLPVQQYDWVMVDEGQDLNRCQTNLIMKARRAGGRVLVVGDQNQCQPGTTMVQTTKKGVVTMDSLEEGDELVSFSRDAGRFVGTTRQGRKVSQIASRPYVGRMLRVSVRGRHTDCTPNHRWVARFTDRYQGHYVTYLMKRDDNYRVGWCQLFNAVGALHVATRARLEKADAIWILGAHKTRTDASVEESIIAARFGLPTICFEPVEGASHLTREAINRVYGELGYLTEKARTCLDAFGRDAQYPFWSAAAPQTRTTLFETQGCNLIPNIMSLPVYYHEAEPRWCRIDQITDYTYQGEVFSLDVETNHTYVADGIATHNSLYLFSGADCSSLDRIAQVLNATRLPLSICYRCPRSHVALAASVFPGIEARDNAPAGELSFDVEEDFAIAEAQVTTKEYDLQDLFICRNTAPLVRLAYRLIRSGKPAKVRGKKIGEGLTVFVKKAATWGHQNGYKGWENFDAALDGFVSAKSYEARENLKEDKAAAAAEALNDKAETIRVIKSTSQAGNLTELKDAVIALFDDHGSATIWLSTIHKAKGLESRRVFLVEPQLIPSRYAKSPQAQKQEKNALYVAYSRAKTSLFILRPHEAGADNELAA